MAGTSEHCTIEEAVGFARRLAAERGWGFGIHNQQPDRVMFEVWDDKTGDSQLFCVVHRITGAAHITCKGSRTASRWIASILLIGIVVFMASVAVSALQAMSDEHLAMVGASPGLLVVAVVAVVVGLLAMMGLLGLLRSAASQSGRFDEMLDPRSPPAVNP